MTDSIRAALERLVKLDEAHEGDRQWEPWLNAIAAARAALAAEVDGPAVPEGREPASAVSEPSDEELLALVPQGSESDFYLPQGLPSNWVDGDFIAPPEAVVAFARAVLARWGRPAPVPAGEVGEPPVELVEQWMREASDQPPGPDARVIAALAVRWGAARVTERQAAPAEGEVE